MMMGAFFGVLGSYFTGSVLFGFLLGMVGGMVIGLFHGIPVRALQGQPGHQRHRTEPAGSGRHHPADAAHLEQQGLHPQVASISTTLDFFAPIPVIGPILAQQSVSFPCDGRRSGRGVDRPLQDPLRPAPAHGGREPKGRGHHGPAGSRHQVLRRAHLRRSGRRGRRLPVPGSVGHVRAQHDRRPRLHRGGHRHPGPVQPRADRALRPAVRLLRRGADLPSGRGLPAPDRADAPLHCDPAGAGLRCQAHQAPAGVGKYDDE